jgi:hypothetical protein
VRRRVRSTVAAALAGFTLGLWGPAAAAQTDYAPGHRGWNGTAELLALATEAEVELVPTTTLDWAEVQRGQAILVLYPRGRADLGDLSSFLEEGGRLAWFDDFGQSEDVWRWFQFQRQPQVDAPSRAPELPELLLARPRLVHPLTEGVDTLVTNIPVALVHPRLSPLFEFAGPSAQGLLLVGQIGAGKLVACGDPSVLVNTMMRFPGNRRFARNLLDFLANGHGGRVTMVYGDFAVRGSYRGRGRPRTRAREAVVTLNGALGALSSALGAPGLLRPLGLLAALVAVGVLAASAWGRRPSERYGPRGPAGSPAGATERARLLGRPGANLAVPTLLARRLLEQRLLRAAGIRPPIDLRAVLERLGPRLRGNGRDEVRALLLELEALGDAVEREERVRVSPRRFLSLWRRISAILPSLERDA